MNEQALFIAALPLDPPSRRSYLDRECAGNDSLRQRVERLLAAYDQAGSFLKSHVPDQDGGADGPTDLYASDTQSQSLVEETADYLEMSDALGTIIAGKYKLIEIVGEGGMGTVYMAQQTEPIKRFVAIKLIKAGMDSKAVLARFEAERQALAMMDHPNIAKILDGGLHENRPYFVMELVKGTPITEFCDARKLSPRERLELFVPVCNAIQHAHQKGIIHRDIKPSNVLIALYDDKPVPKVIDFGVAKATGMALTEQTINTGFGGIVGTPQYMSPEQATFNNLDIDTRSDVYSLGVLLYELLAGSPPFSRKELEKQGLMEILRVVREEEPPRPSAKLSTAAARASIAANRGIEPAKLSSLMKGEIDWIVMRSLEKDRSRRYESANSFAADVQRYLSGEQVQAVPPSLGYRMRKFGRKYRRTMSTAATILLLLLTGVVISICQAVRATHAEWQTTQERDRAIQSEREARLLQTKAQQEEEKALRAAAKANAMIRFFKEVMLESRQLVKDYELSSRPIPGEQKKIRDVRMDEAVNLIDTDSGRALFSDHPLAEAEIREWIGSLAFPTDGQLVVEHSFVRVASSTRINTDPFGKAVIVRYDPGSARRHFQRALDLYSQHLGSDHLTTLETMRKLGRTIVAIDDVKGLEVLRTCVARSTAIFGTDHDETVRCQTSLAQGFDIAEKPAEAAQLWKTLYAQKRSKLGIDHDETLELEHRLASSFELAGNFAEALGLREELLQNERRRSPESSFVDKQCVIARLYEKLHDYKKAEGLWREILSSIRNDDVRLCSVKTSLGRCLLLSGKAADAEREIRECTTLHQMTKSGNDIHIKSLLGGALLAQKKYIEAEPLLLSSYEALKILEGPTDPPYSGGPSNEDRVCWFENLGYLVQLYESMGKKEKSKIWHKKLQVAKDGAVKPAKQ